jgi:uncharacterized membrane protein
MKPKSFLTAAIVCFLVIFNLGYVFHDLIMGDWFADKLHEIAREEYIIPLIGVSYLVYCFILAFLYPMYYSYANVSYFKAGIEFGFIMGLMYDALEGGLIEFATLKMPIETFLVDTSYHLGEGILAGVIIALVYRKFKLPKRSHSSQ